MKYLITAPKGGPTTVEVYDEDNPSMVAQAAEDYCYLVAVESDLRAVPGPVLVELYNAYQAPVGLPTVKKFQDQAAAARRTFDKLHGLATRIFGGATEEQLAERRTEIKRLAEAKEKPAAEEPKPARKLTVKTSLGSTKERKRSTRGADRRFSPGEKAPDFRADTHRDRVYRAALAGEDFSFAPRDVVNWLVRQNYLVEVTA